MTPSEPADPDSEDITPEVARDQLALYAENFHRFVLEAIPRLEHDFHQQTLEDMLKLANHYEEAFYKLTVRDDLLAMQYLSTARRLAHTIRHMLGKPQD